MNIIEAAAIIANKQQPAVDREQAKMVMVREAVRNAEPAIDAQIRDIPDKDRAAWFEAIQAAKQKVVAAAQVPDWHIPAVINAPHFVVANEVRREIAAAFRDVDAFRPANREPHHMAAADIAAMIAVHDDQVIEQAKARWVAAMDAN